MKPMLFLALTLPVLLASGCSRDLPQKFVMPTWDAQLSIPIFNGTFTLAQIVGKDSVVTTKGDTTSLTTIWSSGALSTCENLSLSTVKVGNSLKLKAFPSVSVVDSLGTFSIRSPSPFTIVTMLDQMTGSKSVVGHSVTPMPIPPRTFTFAASANAANFKWAEISSADLTASIVSEYCEQLDFPEGIVFEDSAGETLFTVQLPDKKLDPGESYTSTQKLEDIMLPANPKVCMVLSSPGGTKSVLVKSDTVVLVTMSLKNIKATSAEAVVDPQPPVVISGKIAFPGSQKIQRASIASGTIAANMRNFFNMPCDVKIIVNGMRDDHGNPFEVDRDLASVGDLQTPDAKSKSSDSFSLSNWTMDLGSQPADSISYAMTVTLPGSGGEFVLVSSSDKISGNFTMSSVSFISATGVIRMPNPVHLTSDTEVVSLPGLKGDLNPDDRLSDSTRLTFKLNLTGSLPAALTLRVTARSSNRGIHEADSAVVTQTLYPGSQGNDVVLGKCFADMLNRFISNTGSFPDRFIIDRTAMLNPTNEAGTISKNDAFGGTALIMCPLDVGLKDFNYTLVSGNLQLSAETKKGLDDVDSGRITFEITNALPIGVRFSVMALDTLTHKVLFVLPDTGQFSVASPTRFNDDGTVALPVFSALVVSVTAPEAKMLEHACLEFLVTASTPEGEQTVQFQRSSYVALKMKGEFMLRASSND